MLFIIYGDNCVNIDVMACGLCCVHIFNYNCIQVGIVGIRTHTRAHARTQRHKEAAVDTPPNPNSKNMMPICSNEPKYNI